MNFFVTGLPRSRTAWLANFLTYEKFCFHEGMNGCYSLADYKEKLGEDNGDSNTALALIDVEKEFPHCPVLVIHGDINKSADYMYKTYDIYDLHYVKEMENRLSNIKGMHIDVNEIDDKLPEIWEYLIGTEFDYQRAEMLKRLRIEILDPHDFDIDAMQSLWNQFETQGMLSCL
jgi:hypothetical protein